MDPRFEDWQKPSRQEKLSPSLMQGPQRLPRASSQTSPVPPMESPEVDELPVEEDSPEEVIASPEVSEEPPEPDVVGVVPEVEEPLTVPPEEEG